MDDTEIIDLATRTLEAIADDLQASYGEDGRLDLRWIPTLEVNAHARSLSHQDQPPIHEIAVTYGLAIALYKNIEDVFIFIDANQADLSEKQLGLRPLKDFFGNSKISNLTRNSYLSALTWVFFHELGHLKQGHLNITPPNLAHQFSESYSLSKNNLAADQSALSHCLELAADCFATMHVSDELLRHFFKEPSELEKAIASFFIGISVAIYTFTDSDFEAIPQHPEGSHPPPILRLEMMLPRAVEYFSYLKVLNGYTKEKYYDLVYLCTLNANVCAHIRWHIQEGEESPSLNINQNLAANPPHLRANGKSYLRDIIQILDEIRPILVSNMSNSYHKDSTYVLSITKAYREIVFED